MVLLRQGNYIIENSVYNNVLNKVFIDYNNVLDKVFIDYYSLLDKVFVVWNRHVLLLQVIDCMSLMISWSYPGQWKQVPQFT